MHNAFFHSNRDEYVRDVTSTTWYKYKNNSLYKYAFLVRPKTIVFARTSVLLWFIFSFFSRRVIS